MEAGDAIVPGHQRGGCATEATPGLIARTFDDLRVPRVIGERSEPGVIRFAITRGAWEAGARRATREA